MRWTLLVALLVVVVASCGDDGSPVQTTSTFSTCRDVRLGGAQLRIPDGARPGRTPLLVVMVPGGRGDPADVLGVTRAAHARGIAVLYPLGNGFWTLNDRQGRDDVEAVDRVLELADATGCFDPERISITGVSNGAGFAVRMACERPGRFAHVVPVAAGFRALDPCPATTRASFLAIHGTADTVVPYNGKRPDRTGSVPRFTARWAKRLGCTARRATRPRRLVTRYAWRGCDRGARVELLRLTGTEHGWPGRRGRNPSGLSATDALIRFVR